MNYMQSHSSVKAFRTIRIIQYPIAVILLLCSLFSLQCKKELTSTSPSAKLSFSTSQLFFDTVFVTQGSSVRIFVVHNNNNQAVVTNIKLAGTYTSPFEINVDGVPGTNFSNVKIPANDSIYIFTQVNIDPLNTNNPALIQDSLVFTTNGNIQWVDLYAFGWNAYFYMPNVFPPSGPSYSIVKNGDIWKNDKPHVVFGYLLDSAGSTLTMEPGTRVYFHNNATLYIQGTLKVEGNSSNPVNFQGDRLEPAYNYIPGQWNEIFLAPGSINNSISWAVIQNGTTGIQADTVGNSFPTLEIDHTIIKSMSSYGLYAEGAVINANNCVIADCQTNCVFLYIGGSYAFNQCTFADYWGVDNSNGQRTSQLLYINNWYQTNTGQVIYRPINSALFANCIIYGALSEELKFDSAGINDLMNYYFENCIIKTQQSFPSNHYTNIYTNTDPLFTDPSSDNYIVNPGSPAFGKANPAIPYRLSLDDIRRPATGATLGAYEQ